MTLVAENICAHPRLVLHESYEGTRTLRYWNGYLSIVDRSDDTQTVLAECRDCGLEGVYTTPLPEWIEERLDDANDF